MVVLISFREWLHSYKVEIQVSIDTGKIVLISFREWLHSYVLLNLSMVFSIGWGFSSLSESGFIPTEELPRYCSCNSGTFSSLSESGFIPTNFKAGLTQAGLESSHLFQRVASFLHTEVPYDYDDLSATFSSLSESGFIPTILKEVPTLVLGDVSSHLFQRVASFLLSSDGTLAIKGNLTFSSLSESGFIPTLIVI